MATKTTPSNIDERFWSKVAKFADDSCWFWLGAYAGARPCLYGTIRYNGKPTRAHRVSWEMEYGPIPDSLQVLHTCDNTMCVRPDHLFLGTHADNAADKMAKGRGGHLRGDQSGNAKLTEDDVHEIRLTYSQGNTTHREIAAKYQVNRSSVTNIVRRKVWQHV